MKRVFLLAWVSFFFFACGDNSADQSKTVTDSDTTGIGTAPAQSSPEVNSSADTSSIQGKGTDRIPSRTGTTGQGNTTGTGSATGSPNGTGKDTSRPK